MAGSPGDRTRGIARTVRGATVVFEPFRRARVASLQVWVRAGAAVESDSERGAAHFLEHMLFQGRHDRFGGRGLAASVEEGGGTVNAWTSHDYTVVHVTCPAPSFADVASAVLHNVLATEPSAEVVERERRVILQEIAREEENPGLHCMRTLFEERFAGHPYGRRVVGSAESVRGLTADTLAGFHRRHYVPSSLVIAVVGDLDARSVLELADRELAPYPDRPATPPAITVAGPGRTGLRAVGRDVAEAHFAIGFAVPPLKHPDVPAIDCASGILGETHGSVLEAWRQSEGLVNEVGTTSYTPVRGGTFLVHGAAPPERIGPALARLNEVVADFVASGVGLEAMAAVREDAIASAARADETAHGRAGRLGYEVAATGRPGFFRRYLAAVAALDADQVSAAARRYLARPASTVVVAPDGACGGVAAYRSRRRAARAVADAPSRTVLDGGTVVLHWRDRTHPSVSLRVQAPGGLEHETAETNGLHELLSRLYTCGAGGRSGPATMRDFESLGARFAATAGHAYVTAIVEAPAGRVFPAMALAAGCLGGPDLAAADIDREKALLVEDVRTRVDRPGALLHRELSSRLFAGHPYGLDPSGSREALDRVTRDDLAATAAALLDPAGLTIAVVGDCDAVEVARALVAAIGAHRSPLTAYRQEQREGRIALRSAVSGQRSATPSLSKAPVLIPGPFKQSHVGLMWPGADSSSPDRIPLAVFGAAMGLMSGPLFALLRDRMAVAYSLGFGASAMRIAGYVKASAAVKPGAEDAAIEGIRGELARVLDGGEGAADLLRRGAAHLAGTQEMAFQKKGAVAHWMCTNDLTPLGYDSFCTVADRIRATDPSEAIDAARRALAGEAVVVVLKPEDADR